MHHNMHAQWNRVENQIEVAVDSEPIRIDVFTSKRCLFCGDALDVARNAAKRLTYGVSQVTVVETDINERPDLVEKLDIVALPTIMVGKTRLVGVPTANDIERLVHLSVMGDRTD